MLSRVHQVLIGLLVVQILLVIVMRLHGGDAAPQKDAVMLAGFDAGAVTRVQVFAPGDAGSGGPATKPSVDLVKTGTSWVVASAWNYPVDGTKVTDALGPLGKMAAGEPIATQASRHAQLKVADGEYERKLVITAGGKDTVVYIGAPAGSRRTAVRLGTDARVFAASGITSYTWGAEARAWVDTHYVDVARTDVTRLEITHDATVVTLEASTPGGSGSGSGSAPAVPPPPVWGAAIAGAPVVPGPDEMIDAAGIEQLVADVTSLALTAPADPKRDVSKPTATITIEHKAAGAVPAGTDILDVVADGESYYVHRRGDARAALVEKSKLEKLVTLTRAQLVKKVPPAAGSGAGSGLPPGMGGMEGLPPGMEGMEGLPPGMELPPGMRQ